MDETIGKRFRVPCDMMIPPLVNGNIHKRIVQPAMLYVVKTAPMASMKKLVGTEMKMCR